MLEKNKILLVEDEESLAIGLVFNLEEEGYAVEHAADGKVALEQIENKSFDLIILDVMLPFYDGFEIAERVRKQNPQMPILMLTARTAAKDKVKGLEIGVDDYLTKPFHLEELLLRVKGMLKRKSWYQKSTGEETILQFGKNTVDFETLTAKTAKKEFQLTQHEAMVLKYFAERKNSIVSRQELLENVWNINPEIETRTVDNFIVRLRKYFELNPAKPVFFKSIRSAGYVFSDQ
jgi:two-component system, OmpR family, alkaline phosphatase synthesis response regulator PhoP